jgi:DNA-binding transcriptional ArsR family regulator
VASRRDYSEPGLVKIFTVMLLLAWAHQRLHGLHILVVLPEKSETIASRPGFKYALTRIYAVKYTNSMEAFEIIAEPNRRAILSLLVSSQQSVGEIERQLGMPQPTVSKHLRVLREAGFVESTVDAQRRLYRLKPEPFQEFDAWLDQFRRFWSGYVDALERHLDRMEESTATKRKTRKKERGPNRERDKGETK